MPAKTFFGEYQADPRLLNSAQLRQLTDRLSAAEASIAAITLGAWTAYTPALTNVTLGNGTLVGKYARVGRTIHYRVSLVWGTTTSSSGQWLVSLPFAPNAEYQQFSPIGSVTGEDVGSAIVDGTLVYISGSNAQPTRGGGSAGTITAFSDTAPWTWATGDKMSAIGAYESAA